MQRLNYRYAKAYSLVTFFALLIGFVIVFYAVKRSSFQATIGQLKNLNIIIAEQIKSGKDFSGDDSRAYVIIKKLNSNIDDTNNIVSYKMVYNTKLQDTVREVQLTTYHRIGDANYQIVSHTFMIITDHIYLNGIFMVFAWTFIFLISMVIISSEIISGYILSPFNSTLKSIQRFEINQKTDLKFEKTSTFEFHELNNFLRKMTQKAKKDFTILKEFSENASHELQTPIAVIKAKIELLMQSKLDEEQLIKLTSMMDELEKLSKINQSLTLLTTLENFDNKKSSRIDISEIVEETIVSFLDLIEMKNISLKKNIQKGVFIQMDETLSRVLMNNLFSNAIRHNFINGSIEVEITASKVVIKNTGNPPLVPTEELFERFKKDNQSLNSVGIGLSIVKKICEIFNHSISYTSISSTHILEITFFKK